MRWNDIKKSCFIEKTLIKISILNRNMLTFEQFLLTEMPKHYPGHVSYMKDTKFTPISKRNLTEYHVLDNDGEFIYLVCPSQIAGFVFALEEFQKPTKEVVPVLRVSLRNTKFPYKQAHFLRIRQDYSKRNIATNWYNAYVKHYGGIVSDTEHLEGGKLLWLSFIKKSMENPSYKVYVGIDGNIVKQLDDTWTENDIWSSNDSKKDTVLIYTASSID